MEDVAKKYISVPIVLLEGFVRNPRLTVMNISLYCSYRASMTDYANKGDNWNGDDLIEAFSDLDICVNSVQDLGGIIFKNLPKEKEKPYVGVRIERLLEFYFDETEEIDRVAFLAFLALKSILQQQILKKITIQYMFSRMDGSPGLVEEDKISPEIKKWTSRKLFSKLMEYLELNYQLIRPQANVRGIVYTFPTQKMEDGSLMTRVKMESIWKNKKDNTERLLRLKEEKKLAFLKVNGTNGK